MLATKLWVAGGAGALLKTTLINSSKKISSLLLVKKIGKLISKKTKMIVMMLLKLNLKMAKPSMTKMQGYGMTWYTVLKHLMQKTKAPSTKLYFAIGILLNHVKFKIQNCGM